MKYFIGKCKVSREKEQLFKELYLTKAKDMIKQYTYQKILLIMISSIAFIVALLMLILQDPIKEYTAQGLIRPEEGTGEENLTLWYKVKSGEEGSVDVSVRERILEGEELDSLFQSASEYIDSNILLKNSSADEVSSNLNLMTEIPEMNIKIKWDTGDTEYLSRNGTVKNEELKESVLVQLKATLQYYDNEVIYYRYVKIVPRRLSKEEEVKQKIKHELQRNEEESKTAETMLLPDNVEGMLLTWYVKTENKSLAVLLLVIIAGIALIIAKEQSLKEKKKERELQLLIDYSEIVCKFTLLLNAGMTIRGAFERIVLDYEEKKSQENKPRKKKAAVNVRFAYEELGLAIRELELGRPENTVYEAYGQRCGFLCYVRLMTIIIQNMKKGTKGIIAMLETEVLNAFTERKECAKRLGEEAGTKLLGPMVGMLLIVLLIVVVPAFLNFRV